MTKEEAAKRALELMMNHIGADEVAADPGLLTLALELGARAAGELPLRYTPDYETLELFGINYAVDLFKTVGVAPLGSLIRILKRENGTLWLKVEREGDDKEQEAYQRGFNDHAKAMADAVAHDPEEG